MSTSVNSLWGAIKEAGFTKLGFAGGALAAWFLGFGPMVVGAFIGITIYVNANTIWKYILKGFSKEFKV